MALKIGISSYVSAGFSNPVRWDLVETGTGVLVDSHTENGPHDKTYAFDFVNNIRDIVYTVKMYDVPAGAGLGNLIKAEDLTVSTSTMIFDTDIELVVDGGESYDPVADANSVIVPQTKGKDFTVDQRGLGQMLKTRQVEIIPDTVNGGFALTGDQTFTTGDVFIIKIKPQYVVNPTGSVGGGGQYGDVILVTEDKTVASTDFGKMYIVEGAGKVVNIQLPAKSGISTKIPLTIYSSGTTHNNVVIKTASGDSITALGQVKNTFILSRGQKAEIVLLGSVLYAFCNDVDVKRRGQHEWGYRLGLNRLWADGSEYNTADYPGIEEAMDEMPTGTVVDYTTWGAAVTMEYTKWDKVGLTDVDAETKVVYPNKCLFALSGDGSKFKVPDLRNMFIRALKNSDGSSDSERYSPAVGSYQIDSFRKHSHKALNLSKYKTKHDGFDDVSLQTPPNDTVVNIGGTGGTETRGENAGLIPQIIF